MTERVRQLREQSMLAVPTLTPERALLVTDAYAQAGFVSVPVKRALAFKHLMERRSICLNEGELIVGERGPAPKATFTYPELCCHSLEDLEILDTREKVSFAVSGEMRAIYRDKVIPAWRGRTIREKIFEEMTQEWKDAYEAGVFTEFMEQRARDIRCSTTRSIEKACAISSARSGNTLLRWISLPTRKHTCGRRSSGPWLFAPTPL